MIFQQYVICSKRCGGIAIISREEFIGYKASRRKAEFDFVAWLTSPGDENVFRRKFPYFSSLIDWANRIGMGYGKGSILKRK